MSSIGSPSTFDDYIADYDATVQAAIGVSGEPLAFFADLKARIAREEAAAATRHVLDFGCGIGNSTRALVNAMPDALITGFDPSADSIGMARSRVSGAEFATTSANRLPFADSTFDLATAACVFHHIAADEQQHWVSEIARVLRPGGRFIMFEHNPLNPLTRHVVRNVPFDAGVTLLRRPTVVRLLESSGLRPGASRYYFFFPRFLATLRPLERFLGWVPFGGQFFVVGER